MRLLFSLLVAASLCVLLVRSAGPLRLTDEQDHVTRDRYRRELTLEQREIEYHKQLHLRQDEMVAKMRRKGPYNTSTATPINPDDLSALQALYQSTNGPQWNNKTGWLKGDPCASEWFGVYCIEGHVLQLNLAYNSLSGPLPASLSMLRSLQVIRVYSNVITGEIPRGLFSISSLQVLDVNTNQITGAIPSVVNLGNLTQLVLYGNNIRSVFPREFNAPKLQMLEISSNSFSGNLPDGLSASTGLTDLVVSRNAFTGGFPASYGKLTKLQRMWTFYNNFDQPTIPSSYQNLVNLVEVQADGLSGELPDWIGTSWSKLQNLVLINGMLSGSFPSSLCSSKEMLSLRLFNNSLKGELPDCICNMRKITDIELSDNQLTGKIPDAFQDCRSLESLYLSRNNLSDTFPKTLSTQANLTVIDVSSNGLYGTVPNTLDKLPYIAELAICFNMFSDVEKGLDNFFKRIADYTCLFYNNPWSCPTTATIPKECSAACSSCNAKAQHQSCSACVQSSDCGWCEAGENCLEGTSQGPGMTYSCTPSNWKMGSC